MAPAHVRALVPMLATVSVLAAGCSDAGKPAAPRSKPVWQLTLNVDGADVPLRLEHFDVYLMKRGDLPEVYELEGDGVVLVGEFPQGLSVGFGEDWKVLLGREVAILPKGGYYREPKNSSITLPGKPPMKVLGGTLAFDEFMGELAGQNGDRTLHGRVSIRVKTAAGEATYSGTFAAHAVTWG